jgi:hypothetical protein
MLVREKLLKSKNVYVETHVRNAVTIVEAIEKHQTSQHGDRF